MKTIVLVGALSVMAAVSFSAESNVVRLEPANVTHVTTGGSWAYGGCGFKVDVAQSKISTETSNCYRSNWWISLSCNGQANSEDDAHRMLDTVKQAAELGKRVQVWVDESQLESGGACVAKRVDIRY